MMLNIDSEPMATPITNPRRAKKLRSTSGASARDSTISIRTNAAAASTNGPTTGSGAAPTCGSACSPKTSDTMNVASKTKPVQSARRLGVPSARAVAGNDTGRDAEQRQSDHRCQPCAKPIRRLATEYNAGRGDDQIGIDRPFHAG